MDILDILLDILLKPPQPFIGLFFCLTSNKRNGKFPIYNVFLHCPIHPWEVSIALDRMDFQARKSKVKALRENSQTTANEG